MICFVLCSLRTAAVAAAALFTWTGGFIAVAPMLLLLVPGVRYLIHLC